MLLFHKLAGAACLARMRAASLSLLASANDFSVDPLRIATNAEKDGKVTIVSDQEQYNGFLGLFDFNYIYYFLKREVFIWGAIIIVFLLITMLFISKSEKLAERKADVMHKLLIVFIASSTLFLLSAVVNLLDAIF